MLDVLHKSNNARGNADVYTQIKQFTNKLNIRLTPIAFANTDI